MHDMSNTQLFISVGLPIFIMVCGFIWQNRTTDSVRAELTGKMDGKFEGVNVRLDVLQRGQEIMQNDLKQFNGVTHELDKRVSKLESD